MAVPECQHQNVGTRILANKVYARVLLSSRHSRFAAHRHHLVSIRPLASEDLGPDPRHDKGLRLRYASQESVTAFEAPTQPTLRSSLYGLHAIVLLGLTSPLWL